MKHHPNPQHPTPRQPTPRQPTTRNPTEDPQESIPERDRPGELEPDVLERDVVVIGGAFAGSAVALLLRRRLPESRILVVERRARFERKVGEATVEVSGLFLHKVLGLYDHLSRHHLPKHGLRFWFGTETDASLHDLSEVGADEMPALASFQLDRPVLDEHLLAEAAKEGAEVWREAKVLSVETPDDRADGGNGSSDGRSRIEIETAAGRRRVAARWVIDASGRQSFLARKKGLHRKVERHPVAAMWARWDGVRDLDGVEILGDDPREPRLPVMEASRRLATNHFCGYGYWCWTIPLAHGGTSIGLVYDKSLYEPPPGESLRQRYESFVRRTAGLRELVSEAEIASDESGEDFMALSHLPYRSERYMGRGWALVGDAGAFLDPFYSPGLDHASISVWTTTRIVEDDLAGRLGPEELDERIAEHNAAFHRSYDQWLDALYVGKYELMGDADLLGVSYLFDTAFYFLGVVTPISRDVELLGNPIFGAPPRQARWAYRVARAYNRRLVELARFRRRAGTYGRHNLGCSRYSKPFQLGPLGAVRPVLQGTKIWLGVEWERLKHRLSPWSQSVTGPVSTSQTTQETPP